MLREELHNWMKKNIPAKKSYGYHSNYRHAYGGRQGNYGCKDCYSYNNYFRNIAEGTTVVKDTFMLERFIFKASDNSQLLHRCCYKQQGNFKTWR
jgi:hypothetical protein